MRSAYLLDAVRTPVGKLGGALAGARPDDLAAVTLQELAQRNPSLDPAELDDVILGNANGAGEENRDVARMAALLAGFPTTVPGTTVNRLCGSGLEAAIQAARAIETGDASLVIAGGVESMSRAPWVLPKPDRAFPHGSLPSRVDLTRLAFRQPPDAEGMDGLARRSDRAARREVRRHPRSAGPVRPGESREGRQGLGRRKPSTTRYCRGIA